MIKSSLYIFVLVLVSLFIFVPAYSQEEMEQVDTSAFENPRRVPAVFIHDEHNEKAELDECSECHHIYEDGKKIEDESSEDQSCSECHEIKSSDNKPALMKAFHLNCKGCHMDLKKGPITCGDCHKK